jgi:hypothetical protein
MSQGNNYSNGSYDRMDEALRVLIRSKVESRYSPKEIKGKKNYFVWYIAIILSFSFYAFISLEFFLVVILLISLVYLPFLFAIMNAPKPRVEEEEKVVVDEDISHFKSRTKKALKGDAVAQRDIELRVLNALVIDLSIRYSIPEHIVRRNMENEEFLREYLGDKARIAARMFKRRHDLRNALPKEEFVKEINAILEAMK